MLGWLLLLLATIINLLVVLSVIAFMPWLPIAIFCLIAAFAVRYGPRYIHRTPPV